jgi:hypothetical protein
MNKQPEAIRLADALTTPYTEVNREAANELRRLHEVNAELLGLVKRYRTVTPLGLQPNMIDLEAKEAITKAEKQND